MSKTSPNLNFVSRQPRLIVTKSFSHASLCAVLLGMCALSGGALAEELPTSLAKAIEQVGTEDADQAFGALRRYAYTDKIDQRLAARVALSEIDRNAGRLDRALTWVADYQNPQTENYEWPRVRAYLEAAKIQFLKGNAFESVKRLTDAEEKSSGLAKISIERALSWVVEQKPDLQQALDYEKAALKTGEGYFKRKKISESAGLEPPKPGADLWKEVKPEILERIADLERKLDIDRYGLDYMLYREAQEYRNASHPLAMDFTNVAAAFDQEGPIGGTVPDADYEMAMYRYNEIVQFFPENPYGQAAKLYLAVCTAKTGDPDGAIKQLKDFYKEDPDGLYRGEALKLIGDLYLFAKWDKRNSLEAYERAVRWIEASKERSRALDTYVVPEKSAEVSKPPKEVKRLTAEGMIERKPIPGNALVNRTTSDWYLDSLRVATEWRLSFLDILADDWVSAMEHLAKIREYDSVLKQASEKNYFNAYDRLKASAKQECIVLSKEELRGLTAKVTSVMKWADLQFMIENNHVAKHLYTEIKKYANQSGNSNGVMRANVGLVLVAREMDALGRENVDTIHDWILENPKSPSCPFLLEICATYTSNEPELQQMYFEWIYTKYPNSFYAKRARYYEILHVPELGDMAIREKMIAAFKWDYPDDLKYHDSLDKYQIWFAEQYELEQQYWERKKHE